MRADAAFGTSVPESAPRGSQPPGPTGLPFLGSVLDLRRDVLGFFPECFRRYGDVVSIKLGAWSALLVSHPTAVERILVDDHASFIKNRFFWRQVGAIFGNGLLTSEGSEWQRHRRIAAPAFAARRVDGYAETMARMTAGMLDGWTAGTARNLHADMMGLTLRIAAKTLFDAAIEADVRAIERAAGDLTDEIATRIGRPFLIPDAVPLPGHLRYRRALRTIEAIVARIVAERRARPGDRGDFLSALMAARHEDGRPLSDRQLRDEAVTMLLAGHETTALALSWTLHLLSRHPEVDARLAREVRDVLGDRLPDAADVPKLAYAGKVVMEALRLYPPAWAIGRETVAACEIGGYRVPAGTVVYVSPFVMHRDPRFFADPSLFQPERWTDAFARALPRFAYLPFGGGPRICIGRSFALMEAVLILAVVVRRYRFEPDGEAEIVPSPSITLRPKGGVSLKVAAR